MSNEIKEVQEFLDKGIVQVRDVETVRYFIKRGEKTSQETYNTLTRIIANVGALYVPFRDLPEVRRLKENDEQDNK